MAANETTVEVPSQGLVLGAKTYDRAQFMVRVVLPALGVFYAALAGFWGFPAAESVVGTIAALALLLGTILRQSSKAFAKEHVVSKLAGDFVVKDDVENNQLVPTLRLNDEAHVLKDREVLSFKVSRE